MDRLCEIRGCGRPVRQARMCVRHWREAGEPRRISFEERFWSKVEIGRDDGCWVWVGSHNLKGYGYITIQIDRKGVNRLAHRVAYEALVGPIPEGLQIDHLCRAHACINPSHLEPVTQRENLMRGVGITAQNARKNHCKRGHPFDEENTMILPSGERACRECKRESWRRWRAAQVPA